MNNITKRLSSSLVLLIPMSVFAGGSIGDVANNLMGPTSIVTKVVEIGCYVIGLAFVMMSIAQYKIHRQSPKLVPLATPITLLVLGVIALFIPYLTMQTETGKADVKSESSSALPLPGAPTKGSGLPYPPGHNQQEAPPLPSSTDQGSAAAPATPPDNGSGAGAPATPADSGTGGGGWTTDPKYQH